MMAKVKAPYVYDDTGIKKELDGRKDLLTDRKDRIQNALTIIFHVGKRIVIASMFGIG